jgi:hypothetical protein
MPKKLTYYQPTYHFLLYVFFAHAPCVLLCFPPPQFIFTHKYLYIQPPPFFLHALTGCWSFWDPASVATIKNNCHSFLPISFFFSNFNNRWCQSHSYFFRFAQDLKNVQLLNSASSVNVFL